MTVLLKFSKWVQILYDSEFYFTNINQQLKQPEPVKRCFISVSTLKQNLCHICENTEAIKFVFLRQIPSNFQLYPVFIRENQFLGQRQSNNLDSLLNSDTQIHIYFGGLHILQITRLKGSRSVIVNIIF